MQRLLILGCSERKFRDPKTPVLALQRYDGVFYRVLRKNIREPRPLVLILSAQFGLIPEDTKIPYYDRRMTFQRAKGLRRQVASVLRPILGQQIEDVFVNLGAVYMAALDGITLPDCATFASGGIGTRAAQLKRWLLTPCR